MLLGIPVIGWIINLFFNTSMAIPFWFIWNRLAPKYFYFLPEVYQQIPFWHVVGLFVIIPVVKMVLWPGSLFKLELKKN